MKFFIKILTTVFIIAFNIIAFAQDNIQKAESYNWKNVQIVGGGFVSGIVFHPTEKGLCYCRTDIGGAYKRNPETMRWEPLLDWVTYDDRNTMGVESIALDPSDPDRLYLACGTYTFPHIPNGCILRSNDRGKTFMRTDLPFKLGANENGRGNGERMAVDPNDNNIIYLGTRHDGLWKSADRGRTWNHVKSFPDVNENPPDSITDANRLRWWRRLSQGSGIIFVLFDSYKSLVEKKLSTIYIGVSLINRNNIFRSTDNGETWHALPNQPLQYRPTHGVLSSDGILYVSYGSSPGPSMMTDGGIWKFNTDNSEWKEITPVKPNSNSSMGKKFGYVAVAVDPNNPGIVLASTFGLADMHNGEELFRSTDSGESWVSIFGDTLGTFDFSSAPYVAKTPIHWLFDLEIDPANSDHAIFTTGYGGYETFNLTDADKKQRTKWSVMSTGIEETAVLDLLSPPEGAHLISAIGDYGGFVHWDLDRPSPEGNFVNPHFGNTNSLACAEKSPNIIVRVGIGTELNPGENCGYSTDYGKSWQPTSNMPSPQARFGFIAVSPDGKSWVWAPDPVNKFSAQGWEPQSMPVYFTTDKGTAWGKCGGIPDNTKVIADRVNPNIFYAMDLFGGKFFISSNGGRNFNEKKLNLPGGLPTNNEEHGDSRGGQDKIYSTPGHEGDLWLAAFHGLFHSTDSGNIFSKSENVGEIHAFGFGKEAPGKNYPALFLIGIVDGTRGIFRSDDEGQSWIRIGDEKHQWGLVFQITGDPRIYRRVYIGTHGRGIIYGDPVK